MPGLIWRVGELTDPVHFLTTLIPEMYVKSHTNSKTLLPNGPKSKFLGARRQVAPNVLAVLHSCSVGHTSYPAERQDQHLYTVLQDNLVQQRDTDPVPKNEFTSRFETFGLHQWNQRVEKVQDLLVAQN